MGDLSAPSKPQVSPAKHQQRRNEATGPKFDSKQNLACNKKHQLVFQRPFGDAAR